MKYAVINKDVNRVTSIQTFPGPDTILLTGREDIDNPDDMMCALYDEETDTFTIDDYAIERQKPKPKPKKHHIILDPDPEEANTSVDTANT